MTPFLVPYFILEKYAENTRNGRFSATALFIDISGFSAITDQLMAHGQHGAEVLAGVMGTIFEPLINAVYSQGGFVTGFAGDAFTAVFPQPATTPHQALAAAVAIQEQMAANPEQETPYGRFAMSAKVGVALGEVIWGIVKSEDKTQASYYFQGTAIDGCAESEGVAQPGDVILDAAFYDKVQAIITADIISNHYRLTAVTTPLPAPQLLEPPKLDPELATHFVPEAAVRAGRTGEFRQVVNLFISLPTVRTDAQLDIFMQTVFNLQQQYGGLLKQLDYGDKGAKLLLFWGAPVAHENDIQRALHFILDLQTLTAIPINGGLTYHIAHAGYIGSSLRGEYTCYGRGVNLAARFMSAAPRGEIWVDEHIARRAGAQFDLEFEGQQSFKGFAEPQKVYILFERKDITDTLYDNRLVGRDDEITRLTEFVSPIYANHSDRNGHSPGMLVIWGEPGAGKSHLAHEFLTQYLNPDIQTQVFLAQSDEILRQSLNPFRYWLKQYFGISEGLAESRNKRSFNRKLDALIAATDDQTLADELDRVRSFLAALVGLHWSDSLYEQVDAKGRQENTFAGLTVLLQAESQRQPVILLLEDAHWMDKDSAAFLSTLLPELDHSKEKHFPLAILATARYEGHGLPLEGFKFQEINLSELNQANLAALAQTFLDGPPSENLVNLLVERAEGNPFFAEQLLRYLSEAERLIKVDGVWQVVTLEQSPLPEDVNALLVARLDRLAHTVREVVQTAAVLGREFEVRLLSQMLQGDDALTDKIVQAEKESVWSALSEIRYIFKHGLLRDAAYRMQLRARRQALHKLAMEALESLYEDDLTGRFGELAYHALSADLPESAFRYSLAAGNEAMQHYAAAEAVSHYRPAMALFGQMKTTPEQRHQLCILYGRAIELTGDPEAAYAHYEHMEKLALEIGDQPLELASLVAQGTLRTTGTVLIDNEIAESLSQKAIELAQNLNDKAAEAKILWNLLNIYRRTNREDEAIEAGKRSYELAESLNLKEQMAYSAIDMVKVYLYLGQGAKLMSYGWRAVELWRELDNRPMLVDALTTQAFMLLGIGQLDQALTLSAEAKIISQESKNLWGEALSYYAPAMVHTERLNIEAGLAAFKAGLSLAEEGGVTIVQYYMNMFQANLYLAISDYQNAKKCAERMLSIAEKQLPFHKRRAIGTLALVHLEMGDMDTATELINKLDYDIDNFELNFFLMVEKAVGLYLLYKKAYSDLLRLTTKVLESLEENSLVAFMPDFYYLYAQALSGLQQSDEAKNSLYKGLKISREIGGRRGILKLASPLLKLEKQAGNETAIKKLRAEIETIQEHLKKQNIPSNY